MRLIRALACFALVATASVAAPIGYSIQSNGDQNLYRIDLSTGVATSLGLIAPFGDAEGMAFVGNQLYGIGGTQNELWNVTAAPGSFVGFTGSRGGLDAGLAYDPVSGQLYNLNSGFDGSGPVSYLYVISLTDGAATLVGSGTGYAGSLAINSAGQAYAVDPLEDDGLFSVDLATGAMSFIGSLGLGNPELLGGADFDSTGILWALFDDGSIYTVDTATGLATFRNFVTDSLGNRLADFEGLAIEPGLSEIPEPASFALVAAGLAAVALRRRKAS